MTLTSLSYEAALQRLLVQYNEHQARLEGWIRELQARGMELLASDDLQHGHGDARTTARLQATAQRFFITAMRISKEQLTAAIRLTRLDLFKKPAAHNSAPKPCALANHDSEPVPTKSTNNDSVSCCPDTTYNIQAASTSALDTLRVTPMRAADKPRPESLVDILARETEEALRGLNVAEVNQNIRSYRRQRAKELNMARQS